MCWYQSQWNNRDDRFYYHRVFLRHVTQSHVTETLCRLYIRYEGYVYQSLSTVPSCFMDFSNFILGPSVVERFRQISASWLQLGIVINPSGEMAEEAENVNQDSDVDGEWERDYVCKFNTSIIIVMTLHFTYMMFHYFRHVFCVCRSFCTYIDLCEAH